MQASAPRFIAGILAALLIPSVAHAEADPARGLSLQELLDIKVVSSTLLEEDLRRAPSTIHSYSRDDLRRWGIRSIGELIAWVVPGTFLAEDGDETIAAFRGVATDNNAKVLTLVNGHPINPEWAKGATPELELGLLEDLDHVEVIVGPGSALYGSGATIGVINIITRKPSDSVDGSATVALGSAPRGLADACFRGRAPTFGFVASAGGLRSDGYERRDGSPGGNAPLFIDGHPLNGRAFTLVEFGSGTLLARYVTQSRNLYNNTTNPVQQATGPAEYEIWNQGFGEYEHRTVLSDRIDLRLSVSGDVHETKRYDYLRGWQTRAIGERHAGSKTQAFWRPTDRLDVAGGVEYQYDDFGDDFAGRDFQAAAKLDPATGRTSGLDASRERRMITPYDRHGVGTFGQVIFRLTPAFTVLGGLRYDWIESDVIRDDQAFTPRVGLVAAPDDRTTLKALFSTGFRPPMAILTSPDGYMLGSPAYRSTIDAPERVRSFELSADHLFADVLQVGLNAFYNRFRDLHSLKANPDGTLEFLSGGEVDYMGGEAILRLALPRVLRAQLCHQMVVPGISRSDPGNVLLTPDNRHLAFYPEHATKALIEIPVVKHLHANINSILVWNVRGYEGIYGQESSVRETGAYAVLNGSVVVDMGAHGELAASGYNLLDTDPSVPFSGTIGRPVSFTRIAGFHWDLAWHREF